MGIYAYCYYVDCFSRISDLVVSVESLKHTKPKYPIYCLVGDGIFRNMRVINFLNDVVGVHTLLNPHPFSEIIYSGSTIFDVFCCSGKLKFLQPMGFDKIVVLDSDTYITRNMDEIFDYPSGSMATHKIGNQIDCIIRAYSCDPIGTYQPTYDGEPYTIIKGENGLINFTSRNADMSGAERVAGYAN